MSSIHQYPSAFAYILALNQVTAMRAATYLNRKAGELSGCACGVLAIEIHKRGNLLSGSSCSVALGATLSGSFYSTEAFNRIHLLKEQRLGGITDIIASSMVGTPSQSKVNAGCIVAKGPMGCDAYVSFYGLISHEADEAYAFNVAKNMRFQMPKNYANRFLEEAPDTEGYLAATLVG